MNLIQMKQELEATGYTLPMLSELSGIPADTIEQLFSGEIAEPSYDLLSAIEKVLKSAKCKDYIKEPSVEYASEKAGYTIKDYYALPDDQRAELIDGAFYVMEAPTLPHQDVTLEIGMSIRNFVKKKKGHCKAFVAPVDVQLDCDDKTMVQPDILIVCDSDKLIKQCVFGAPDFVAEVLSKSTKNKDMNLKLMKYKRAGVREYWLIDTEDGKVITYFFETDEMPRIYGMQDVVPVLIFGGELEIDFGEVSRSLGDVPGWR